MAQNYTRQSTLSDGDTITASLFNDEYNQLVNAFTYSSTSASSTGHRHDGSSGQGGNIFKIGDLDFLNKIEVDSTNNRWGFYVEVSSAAVEQIRIQDGAVVPVTTNDIDLGTSSLQFKDLYIDGTANVDSLTLASGSTVTTILDEDDLSSDSATALVTQQSVKAYVDAQVTAQDLDFQADSGGALSIDLDSEALTFTGGTGVDTSGSGNAVTFAIDSTVATLTGTQTLTNKTLTSPDVNTPDIDGGTIDGTVIGGTTAAAVSATTVSATGNITVGGTVDGRDVATDGTKLDGIEALADVTDTTNVTAAGALMDSELTSEASVKALNQGVATTDSPTFAGATVNGTVEFDGLSGTGAVTVTDILDQDNMSSNSATALATQQSIKSYVDSQVATSDTLAEVLANGNATGGTDVAFGDNDKALFGAGSDLKLYHTGSHSYIDESGTGNLYIGSNNGAGVYIQGSGETLASFLDDGAVTLYNDNAPKLATTSTGIDVTGSISADGLTVDTGSASTTVATLSSDLSNAWLNFESGGNSGVFLGSNNGQFRLLTDTTNRLAIATNGDVSLYEDTGTTAKFQWSASDESLSLDKTASGVTKALKLYNNTAGANNRVGIDFHTASTLYGTIEAGYGATSPEMNFKVGGVTPSQILKLTSTGIDVSGTATMDGLTVDGEGTFTKNQTADTAVEVSNLGTAGATTTASFIVSEVAGTPKGWFRRYRDGTATTAVGFSDKLVFEGAIGSTPTNRMEIASNGDISFYEDTGTTAKFFWDSSAESLGIGTSSISTSKLHVQGTTGTASAVRVESTAADSDAYYIADNDASVWTWGIDGGNSDAWTLSNAFGLGAPKLTVKTSGNVGIGTDAPAYRVDVAGTGRITNGLYFNNASSGGFVYEANAQPLRFGTVGTERMRIDSSGRLLVGTDTYGYAGVDLTVGDTADSQNGIGIQTSTTGVGYILFGDGTGADSYRGQISYKHGDDYLAMNTAGAERMRIDSTGNLRVGAGNTFEPVMQYTNSGRVEGNPGFTFNGDLDTGMFNPSTQGTIAFSNNGSESMRIDVSGNLLVGTTDNNVYNDATGTGTVIQSNGIMQLAANNGTPLYANRQGNDGDIIDFRKDGSPVGSIGSALGDSSVSTLFIADAGNVGIRFDQASTDDIQPCTSAGANRDDAINLGASGNRFKNLYLSGGVVFGTTGGNVTGATLDDYEEGTWTGAVADAESGGNESSTGVSGTYVKIGKIVYLQFNVSNIVTTGMTAGNDVHITGLPFTSANLGGNAKYTGTAHMSVVTFEQIPLINLSESSTVLKVIEVRSGAGVDSVVVSQLSSGASDIHGNLVYQTT
ncbi:hypothetical protein N9Y81_04385 [Akkermansiaceae bacterium]|nr:hypothetical protein [Akkermansiaceae bacterium]